MGNPQTLSRALEQACFAVLFLDDGAGSRWNLESPCRFANRYHYADAPSCARNPPSDASSFDAVDDDDANQLDELFADAFQRVPMEQEEFVRQLQNATSRQDDLGNWVIMNARVCSPSQCYLQGHDASSHRGQVHPASSTSELASCLGIRHLLGLRPCCLKSLEMHRSKSDGC